MDTARVALNNAIEVRSEAIRARDAAEAKLSQAGAGQLDGVHKDNLVALRSQHDAEIRDLDTRIGGLQAAIAEIEKNIASKKAAKREAAPQIHKAAHRAAAIAEEMQGLLTAIAKRQADVAREQLEDLIADNYVIYKSNIRVGIDARFRVRLYDNTGNNQIEKPVGDLSGSETALLTYAFAAAAAKLIPQYQTLDKLLTTVPKFTAMSRTYLWLWTPHSPASARNTSAV